MAEGGHGHVPEKFKFSHVRDESYGVRAASNPYRLSLKRGSAEELHRSSPRFNHGLPNDADDVICLSAGYFKGVDGTRNKKPLHEEVLSSSKGNDMEERLKFFGIPAASFIDETAALKHKTAFKDVVETWKKPLGELPAYKRKKEISDAIEKCDAYRSSGESLRTPHRCLGSLQIKF